MNIHLPKTFPFRTGFLGFLIFCIFGIAGFSHTVFADSKKITVVECPKDPDAPPGSYLGPSALEFLDDDTLCVLQKDAKRLDIFSLSTQTVLRSVSLPATPNKMLKVEYGENPESTRIYISCGDLNGEVLEIDPFSMEILRRWQGIHSPYALAYAKTTGTLFIARRFHSDIFVVDVSQEPSQALAAAPKVKVVREPTAMILAPDESRLYVANLLPKVPSNGPVVAADLSILDTKTLAVKNVQMTDGTASVRGICITPDGKYVFAVHVSSNHRAITSQLSGGWTNRNGMTILDVERDDYLCCYLVDEHLLGAPNPWSVGISPDGKLLAITFAGCQEVGFIGVEELISRMHRDLKGISSGYKMVLNVGSLMQTQKMVHRNEIVGPRALVMNDRMTVAAGYFSFLESFVWKYIYLKSYAAGTYSGSDASAAKRESPSSASSNMSKFDCEINLVTVSVFGVFLMKRDINTIPPSSFTKTSCPSVAKENTQTAARHAANASGLRNARRRAIFSKVSFLIFSRLVSSNSCILFSLQ